MRIFIICTVRKASEEYLDRLYKYTESLELEGHRVHLPPRDTNQIDDTGGYIICNTNRDAIELAHEVHIFEYNEQSTGQHFDIGVAFALNKKIKRIGCPVDESIPKSFPKMLKYWEENFEKNN